MQSASSVSLGLADRDDPITEIVATAIVSIASTGELDPVITLGTGRLGADAA
jgi:hypothetical protein